MGTALHSLFNPKTMKPENTIIRNFKRSMALIFIFGASLILSAKYLAPFYDWADRIENQYVMALLTALMLFVFGWIRIMKLAKRK